jgi:hypothetical protein
MMRLWKDRLKEPVVGINALLPMVPRDPADPAPPAVSILDATQYVWTPDAKIPNKVGEELAPFFLITLASPEVMASLPGAPEVAQNSDEIDLVALYIGFASAKPGDGPHQVLRDALHTVRAARRSTELWFQDSTPESYAARSRNDVQLVRPVRSQILHFGFPTGGAFIGAGLLFGAEVTDRWAQAIT